MEDKLKNSLKKLEEMVAGLSPSTATMMGQMPNPAIEIVTLSKKDKSAKKKELNENLEYHKELNPELWESKDKLKKEVLKKLRESANLFIDFLEIKDLPVVDIVLTGSSANYNYTEKSDIDIHVIIDMDKVAKAKDCPFTPEYYKVKKSLFNKLYNIYIKGNKVELYAEDEVLSVISTGIYSIAKDKWLKKPVYNPPFVSKGEVKIEVKKLKKELDDLVNSGANIEKVNKFVEKLKNMRKKALETKGEYSEGNLIFKELRNQDVLAKAKDYTYDKASKDLSIE